MQNQLYQKQQFFRITMKKPIVSNSSKPLGEHMLNDQMQKVLPFKGAISYIAGLAFNILKSYPAILIGNDILFTDNAPV